MRNMWRGGEKTQPAVDEGLDSRLFETLVARLRTMEMDGRQVTLIIFVFWLRYVSTVLGNAPRPLRARVCVVYVFIYRL